jgi:hypothetical protein
MEKAINHESGAITSAKPVNRGMDAILITAEVLVGIGQ